MQCLNAFAGEGYSEGILAACSTFCQTGSIAFADRHRGVGLAGAEGDVGGTEALGSGVTFLSDGENSCAIGRKTCNNCLRKGSI